MTVVMEGPSSRTHGTRACYTSGCRCEACTKSNLDRYHARKKKIAEEASSVKPSGPPIPGTLIRAGKVYSVLRCPGANGKKCVKGGSWLRVGEVCSACVERVTVWNGLVPAQRARMHLQKLSKAGVGYKSVADACSVGHTAVLKILTGKVQRIRAVTEKEILSVDSRAIAGGTIIDAARTNQILHDLLALGFRKAELARHLGATTKNPSLQLGKKPTTTVAAAARIDRFVRQLERGEVAPRAWGSTEEVKELIRRGIRVPKPGFAKSILDEFLYEMNELRELRKLKPKNLTVANAESTISLASFKE